MGIRVGITLSDNNRRRKWL